MSFKITKWNLSLWLLQMLHTHNHSPALPSAHPIHWQFARTDKVKELIVSQTYIGAGSRQVVAAI